MLKMEYLAMSGNMYLQISDSQEQFFAAALTLYYSWFSSCILCKISHTLKSLSLMLIKGYGHKLEETLTELKEKTTRTNWFPKGCVNAGMQLRRRLD